MFSPLALNKRPLQTEWLLTECFSMWYMFFFRFLCFIKKTGLYFPVFAFVYFWFLCFVKKINGYDGNFRSVRLDLACLLKMFNIKILSLKVILTVFLTGVNHFFCFFELCWLDMVGKCFFSIPYFLFLILAL